MRANLSHGQSGPWALEAEAVLVLARFALALALAHMEDGRSLLLVDLGRGDREARVLGPPGGRASTSTPARWALALTTNQSTWLRLPGASKGHLRRAVLPTSTSTSSGVGCSASPGTPGAKEGALQQLRQP